MFLSSSSSSSRREGDDDDGTREKEQERGIGVLCLYCLSNLGEREREQKMKENENTTTRSKVKKLLLQSLPPHSPLNEKKSITGSVHVSLSSALSLSLSLSTRVVASRVKKEQAKADEKKPFSFCRRCFSFERPSSTPGAHLPLSLSLSARGLCALSPAQREVTGLRRCCVQGSAMRQVAPRRQQQEETRRGLSR